MIRIPMEISIHDHEKWLGELIKSSPQGKCFDLLTNSLNEFCKEKYRDQLGEFVCGSWSLKGKFLLEFIAFNPLSPKSDQLQLSPHNINT